MVEGGQAPAVSGEVTEIEISDHTNSNFNGVYYKQDNPINGNPSFSKPKGQTLYFYDMSDGGALLLEGGVIDVKNRGSQSVVRYYCESSNAHYAQIQAPAHSDFSGNVTLTLPASTDTIAGIAAAMKNTG